MLKKFFVVLVALCATVSVVWGQNLPKPAGQPDEVIVRGKPPEIGGETDWTATYKFHQGDLRGAVLLEKEAEALRRLVNDGNNKSSVRRPINRRNGNGQSRSRGSALRSSRSSQGNKGFWQWAKSAFVTRSQYRKDRQRIDIRLDDHGNRIVSLEEWARGQGYQPRPASKSVAPTNKKPSAKVEGGGAPGGDQSGLGESNQNTPAQPKEAQPKKPEAKTPSSSQNEGLGTPSGQLTGSVVKPAVWRGEASLIQTVVAVSPKVEKKPEKEPLITINAVMYSTGDGVVGVPIEVWETKSENPHHATVVTGPSGKFDVWRLWDSAGKLTDDLEKVAKQPSGYKVMPRLQDEKWPTRQGQLLVVHDDPDVAEDGKYTTYEPEFYAIPGEKGSGIVTIRLCVRSQHDKHIELVTKEAIGAVGSNVADITKAVTDDQGHSRLNSLESSVKALTASSPEANTLAAIDAVNRRVTACLIAVVSVAVVLITTVLYATRQFVHAADRH